jgi:hypothetical protein
MNGFERWLFRGILEKEVRASSGNLRRISNLYAEIRDACEAAYYEDSAVTLDMFLEERFNATQSGLYSRKNL